MATDIVGSNMPSRNGHGQNGDTSPTSVPLNNIPKADFEASKGVGGVPDGGWQTRDVGKSGMAAKAPGAKK